MSYDADDESESSMSSLSLAASSCNTHLSLSYHLAFNDPFMCDISMVHVVTFAKNRGRIVTCGGISPRTTRRKSVHC
jgi:hypothetical protein